MLKNEFFVIGVMSGTSLDGVDLAYVRLKKDEIWKYEFLKCETVGYSNEWKTILSDLTQVIREDLLVIDKNYTSLLFEIISNFILRHQIGRIDFVSSHGHTALHVPDEGFTYQIGNLPQLASNLNVEVICDFRTDDVDLGGEGAPLAPMGDELLFMEYDYCLNLGGFANVSTKQEGKRIAYDICPLNIVLNHYVHKTGVAYDDEGILASRGEVNSELLQTLNNLPYYKENPPKSLGLEWVEANVFPLINSFKLKTQDILRTFVEHTALKISESFKLNGNVEVLATGGGAYNLFFIEVLKKKSSATIVIPDRMTVEFKEALIFALLGALKKRDEINVLSSVTGAKMDHSSGKIFSI